MTRRVFRSLAALAVLLPALIAGCARDNAESAATLAPPTPTPGASTPTSPAVLTRRPDNFLLIATDAPSRAQIFTDIDPFGEIVGFDPAVMRLLAEVAAFDYEFVVTSFDGIMAAVAAGEFDAVVGGLIVDGEPEPGIAYTEPYLELGQMLVVLANNETVRGPTDIAPEMRVGAAINSPSAQTARAVLGLDEPSLVLYRSTAQAVQGLIDGEVDGVLMSSEDADFYTRTYYQQLKPAGGVDGQTGWINRRSYGIAVAASNQALLERLNAAIAAIKDSPELAALRTEWLASRAPIVAGESLIGTPPDEVVVGVVGQLSDLDPAAVSPDPVSWEVKLNTMSGLYRFDAENNLMPMLVESVTVAADQLQYSFTLRPELRFPDGRILTAEDVRWSWLRAARNGNWMVNSFLKDENDDGFADDDAIQVLGQLSLRVRLDAPTSYFFSLLATPPYYVVSQDCFAPTFDPTSACGGIGPYQVEAWMPGEQLRLVANPDWPGDAPNVPRVQLRFYDDAAAMRGALENEAIDMAWVGLPPAEAAALRDQGFRAWTGPTIFKSYLVFEQSQAPWDDERIRQAAAYAVDREALADGVFRGERLPLYSPVPDQVPGHLPGEPARDLDRARSLLNSAGYGESRRLEITLWYLNDGRYTPLEENYARAIKAQLEETGIFQVSLQGAPWEVFRTRSVACELPAYLLGWPPSGSPPRIIEAIDWISYFVTATDTVCSNYESETMAALLQMLEETSADPADPAERQAIYAQIQALWGEEFPTLDLTQRPSEAIAAQAIGSVHIDALGLLHYALLTKVGATDE